LVWSKGNALISCRLATTMNRTGLFPIDLGRSYCIARFTVSPAAPFVKVYFYMFLVNLVSKLKK
jgi:hypothetical protein